MAEFSTAEWWTLLHPSQARWRTSSTLQWCANQRVAGGDPDRCRAGSGVHAIVPGDRYFDTGEAAGPVTLRLCADCARRRLC
jgi:hypothetical protein